LNPSVDKPLRTLPQWLSYLESIHSRPIDLGLERVRSVARSAGLLPVPGKVILVAGTNGKGSTVAALDSVCRAAGYKTATYTSPHLIDYRERVLINNQMLPAEEHCEAFAAIEAARGTTTLTYFEFGTLAAFYLIGQHNPDVTILEIGLGGRLDAVNIAEPDVAIVTSVGIDHIDFLGDDREQIGFEKAGVFRGNKPAVCGDISPPERLVSHANDINAELSLINQHFTIDATAFRQPATKTDEQAADQTLSWELPPFDLPTISVACALQALAQCPDLSVTQDAVWKGLSALELPGRFQRISDTPAIYLDVGHNPHAAQWLAGKLKDRQAGRADTGRVLAVCGMLCDKDIHGTLSELSDIVDHWIFTTTAGSRGTSGDHLQSVYFQLSDTKGSSECAGSVVKGVKKAIEQATMNDTIVVFGSFVTVGEALKAQEAGRL